MSQTNGGPRLWNRGDMEAVMRFVVPEYAMPHVRRGMELMQFIEDHVVGQVRERDERGRFTRQAPTG